MELWKENYEKIEPTKEEKEGKYERIDKLNTQAANITNISQEDLGILGGTLIARYPVRKLNIRQKRIYWYCECPYCGTYKYVLSAEFKKGQSKCSCQGTIDYKKLIKIGDVFGHLTVIDITDSGIVCKCNCDVCKAEGKATIKTCNAQKLIVKHTTSCGRGVTNSDITSVKPGDWYGHLEILEKDIELSNNAQGRTWWKVKCHLCGEIQSIRNDQLTHNHFESCLKCREKFSINEQKIKEMLEKLNISFTVQQTFNDLKDKLYLPFDFFVKNNYIIEFDGAQHFKPVANWNFEKGRVHDLMKNKYCFEHNIPLIRIPYDVEYDFNDLVLETTRFLLTPQNEKEYYESRG